jgi:hypothetical protein
MPKAEGFTSYDYVEVGLSEERLTPKLRAASLLPMPLPTASTILLRRSSE